MKILLEPQDHCGSHNNFMKFFWKIYLNIAFSLLKTAFDEDRYLYGVLSTCEDVRENFEEKNSSSYRLIQGQFGWPIRVITNYI